MQALKGVLEFKEEDFTATMDPTGDRTARNGALDAVSANAVVKLCGIQIMNLADASVRVDFSPNDYRILALLR